MKVPSRWQRVEPPTGHDVSRPLIFMHDAARQPADAVTFSVASSATNPGGNLVGAGLIVRHALQGRSAYSNVHGRLAHLDGVTAYEISYIYKGGDRVFRGAKYVVAKAKLFDVITYEALLKDSAAVAKDFARSARSLQWLRGPYGLDIRSITVSRTQQDLLHLAVRFRHPVSLTNRSDLQLLLDTDENPRTGVQGGEYALDYSGSPPTAELLRAAGGQVHASAPPTLGLSTTPTSATFRINARYIGGKTAFRFWGFASTGHMLDDVAPSDNLNSVITHGPPTSEWTYTDRTRRTYKNP